MTEGDFDGFIQTMTAASELYGRSLSEGVQLMYWVSLQRFTLEEVSRAFASHVADPEAGKFMPKPADLIRCLEGTHSDRANIAWGKALDAARSVGSYTDVIFDDPIIHVVVEDLGGWPKLCRTEAASLGYVQNAFCKSYEAYSPRIRELSFPPRLGGDRSPDSEYERKGLAAPQPVLIGNPALARRVLERGTTTARGLPAPSSMVGLLTTTLALKPTNASIAA